MRCLSHCVKKYRTEQTKNEYQNIRKKKKLKSKIKVGKKLPKRANIFCLKDIASDRSEGNTQVFSVSILKENKNIKKKQFENETQGSDD